MLRRVVSWSVCSVLVASVAFLAGGCEMPDAPLGANTQKPAPSCVDSLGTTFSLTPAESTVAPGATVKLAVNRNGGLYTPGPGSPVIHYDAPQGGTLADPDAIETDYTAGTKPGDYTVTAAITVARGQANEGSNVCILQSIVHVVAAASDAGIEAGSSTAEGARKLDLSGPWSFVEDANQNDPAPVMTLGAASADSVTVTYEGTDGMKCDCNAYHKVIPLGRSYDCSTTTIELDYASSGSFGGTSNEALSIRFCRDGKCGGEGAFYGGDQFAGSEQTGHSNCAWPWNNELPAPQLKAGHNSIDLGKLQSTVNGSCSGSFDSIDVHLQAYACFKDRDKGSATLSNLVIR